MSSLGSHINNFRKYGYLLRLMVSRNIHKKYKGSLLGVAWSLISPLLDMIVLTIVFSSLLSRQIENFPVYLLCGKLIFSLFSSATNSSLFSIHRSADLIRKVYLPKYILILSYLLSDFVFFLITLIDLGLIMFVTGATITWTALFGVLYIGLMFIFTTGVSFILASLSVFFRDIQHIYGVFTTALLYASAIFYPPEIVPAHYQWILEINPMFHFIQGFRRVVYYGFWPDETNVLVCILLSVVSLLVGILVFRKNQDRFIFYL